MYYAKCAGSSSWSKQLVASQSKKIDALGVGIDADSHNNIYITWSIEQQGNPIYYAFIGADGTASVTHTDSGGYNPTVESNIQGLAYRHIAYEVFDGDAPHTEYLLYSYKAANAGRRYVHIDPRGTAQRCSRCSGVVKKELSVRVHQCPYCGLEMDRDLNAALNIVAAGLHSLGENP